MCALSTVEMTADVPINGASILSKYTHIKHISNIVYLYCCLYRMACAVGLSNIFFVVFAILSLNIQSVNDIRQHTNTQTSTCELYLAYTQATTIKFIGLYYIYSMPLLESMYVKACSC